MDVNEFLSKQRKPSLVALGTLALVLVGTVDYVAVGQLLEVSVFFLIPVSFFTWFVNRKAGFIVSAAGAAIIMGVNLASQCTRRIHGSATGTRLSGWGFSC